jgi:hypothetical protein
LKRPFSRNFIFQERLYPLIVIPAKAGIHRQYEAWIPAFAGMTVRQDELFRSENDLLSYKALGCLTPGWLLVRMLLFAFADNFVASSLMGDRHR